MVASTVTVARPMTVAGQRLGREPESEGPTQVAGPHPAWHWVRAGAVAGAA
jgi:hypothetical protein